MFAGYRHCKKCGKALMGLFDGALCDECEEEENRRMTKEEAKRRLEVWLKCMDCPEDKQCYDSHLHSTCEYTDYCDETPVSEAVKVAIKALEQQPCDDAISCEAVIEWLKAKDIIKLSSQEETARKELKALPPVNLQTKTGHWIEHPEIETSTPEYLMFYECSECGNKQCFCKSDIHKKRFCSNCGAKMESEDNENGIYSL